MSTGTVMPAPVFTGLDSNGNPLSGGKLYSYAAGTTTPQATYTDVTLTVPNANPIILDSAGRAVVYLTPGKSFKFVLQQSDGSSVWTQDNVAAVPTSASNFDVLGTAGETLAANTWVYLQDGTVSGKSPGSWYLVDYGNPYSSVTPPLIGQVPSSISSGSAGTIRLSGSGSGSFTPGADYYVGTGGTLTGSPPANGNRRIVGRADSSTSIIIGANGVLADTNQIGGRLTLTSGTPITTADVTAATSVYYTPYRSSLLTLYDGTSWRTVGFQETTIAVPNAANTVYDVFAYLSTAGVLTFETVAWTNDTTRATALTTQDGILVKSAATGRRYLGSFRTTAVAGQTEDSFAKRYVWNMYNRARRVGRVSESTDSWAYTTATWRQANNAAANQLDFVIGWADNPLHAEVKGYAVNSSNVAASVGIGQDSTSAPASGCVGMAGTPFSTPIASQLSATLDIYPAVGRHYYPWLEYSTATGTTTWYGDNGAALLQSAITGWIEG